MSRSFLTLILVAMLGQTSFAQFTIGYNLYDPSGTYFGASVALVGDVDGDGMDDVFVGIPLKDVNFTDSGTARLHSGADGSIIREFHGNAAGLFLGSTVACAGDLNLDGIPDLMVGVPGAAPGGSGSGQVRIYSGLDGSPLYLINGTATFSNLGGAMSSAGDVNGDGHDDVILGASGNNNSIGYVLLISGIDGSPLHTFTGFNNGDYFGSSVAGVGDVDGDGHDDLLIGAMREDGANGTESGVVRIYSGFDYSLIFTLNGDSNGDWFGVAAAGPGDMNGDGVPDIAVGSRFDDFNGLTTKAGSARVFSGADGSPLYTFWGNNANDEFGTSVAAAGDVNLDGYADLIVGDPKDTVNGGCGSARVLSGFDGSTLASFVGDNIGDEFGGAVAGGGDVNGDGVADLIVGAKLDDNFGSASGSVRIFFSPSVSAPPVGGGQANSPNGTFLVNMVPTGAVAGPFVATITRGQYFSLDFRGAPYAFYEVYGSYNLNPGGWDFPGFGSFDLGTGPTFGDVFIVMPGFQNSYPFYALDATGNSHLSYFVQPFLVPGAYVHLQAVVQNPQPWQNNIWGTITAAQSLVVQ